MSWETVQGEKGGDIVKLQEVGQELVGVYVGLVQGLHGPLYQIEEAGGKIVSLPNNKDLEEKLDPEKVLDKLVRIRYDGVKPIKGGKTFKCFTVSVYQGDPTPEMLADYPSLKPAPGLDAVPAALGKEKDDGLPF